MLLDELLTKNGATRGIYFKYIQVIVRPPGLECTIDIIRVCIAHCVLTNEGSIPSKQKGAQL